MFPLDADFILFRVRKANADVGSTIGVAIACRVIKKFPRNPTQNGTFCPAGNSNDYCGLIAWGFNLGPNFVSRPTRDTPANLLRFITSNGP